MNELSPAARDQRQIDAGHLQLLSIFHFVGAGFALLGVLFLVAHYVFFHALMANTQFWRHQNQQPPPPELLAALKWFYLILGVWFVTSGVLNLVSAFCLRARKNRTFSIVVAAINCAFIPLGTVLGVFTIVILARSSVREVYEVTSPPALGGGVDSQLP